jgi:hypothetical protein
LIVATYVLPLGTGESSTVATLTGIAWGAAATGGGADLQPASRQTLAQTENCKMRRELKVEYKVFLLQSKNTGTAPACPGLHL